MNKARLLLLSVNQTLADINGQIQSQTQVKWLAAQQAAQVSIQMVFSKDPLQKHEWLIFNVVHVKAAYDIGMCFQRDPSIDFT